MSYAKQVRYVPMQIPRFIKFLFYGFINIGKNLIQCWKNSKILNITDSDSSDMLNQEEEDLQWRN